MDCGAGARHRIDAAFVLTPLGTRPSATGTRFVEIALEDAGIPVFSVHADMVDARLWDGGEDAPGGVRVFWIKVERR